MIRKTKPQSARFVESSFSSLFGRSLDYDEAIAHYRRALEARPDFAEVHNNLGNALAGLKRRDEAIAQYRRAIELKSDFFEAHNNLGNTLAALKRHTDAVPHFRKALAINPHLEKVPELVKQLSEKVEGRDI